MPGTIDWKRISVLSYKQSYLRTLMIKCTDTKHNESTVSRRDVNHRREVTKSMRFMSNRLCEKITIISVTKLLQTPKASIRSRLCLDNDWNERT